MEFYRKDMSELEEFIFCNFSHFRCTSNMTNFLFESNKTLDSSLQFVESNWKFSKL